jgi:hypothetical protein
MRDVHNAVNAYYTGQYDAAQTLWENVLKANSTYLLGYVHLGKVLYKQEDWKASMEMFRNGKDKRGYSMAFDEYKRELLKVWFVPIMLATAALLYSVFRLFLIGRAKAASVVIGEGVGSCLKTY